MFWFTNSTVMVLPMKKELVANEKDQLNNSLKKNSK
jgi:hypothetical protein